jgi:hypothetical protein
MIFLESTKKIDSESIKKRFKKNSSKKKLKIWPSQKKKSFNFIHLIIIFFKYKLFDKKQSLEKTDSKNIKITNFQKY